VDARARAEAKKRNLLRDIERALMDALAESPAIHQTLWKLQREGWTLRLFLDCQREDDGEHSVPLTAAAGRNPGPPAGEPSFRIDAEDLRLLRSLGIDPTRRRAARRGR
jgi:hypothetical protein